MSLSVTFVASSVTFCVRRCWSSFSFTRKSTSFWVMPEVSRNCLYCLSFGKTCFFWSSSAFCSSASLILMPRFAASCWTHSPWIRNCMTSRLSVSYSLLHCFFIWSSVGCFCPFGTGVFFFAATQASKSGGFGTAEAPPPDCAWPLTAIAIHLSNSSCVIVESPTSATAPAGTLLPQPDSANSPRRVAARASRDSLMARVVAKRARRVANGKCISLSFVFRFGGHLENRLRGAHHRPEALVSLVQQAHAHGLAARLVHRFGYALAERLSPA